MTSFGYGNSVRIESYDGVHVFVGRCAMQRAIIGSLNNVVRDAIRVKIDAIDYETFGQDLRRTSVDQCVARGDRVGIRSN
jgi:hypothetical protein